MKWYHFQEGGPVPKPQFQTLNAANQRNALVDEITEDLYANDDAAAWALANQRKYFDKRFGGVDEQLGRYGNQLGEFGNQIGGYGTQLDEFGNQIGGFDERFSEYDKQLGGYGDQLNELQKQFGGFQNQAAIDQAIAVDQAERDALSRRIPGRVPPPRNCLLYTSPSPRDRQKSRMPSSA